jgi:hypothetical protein
VARTGANARMPLLMVKARALIVPSTFGDGEMSLMQSCMAATKFGQLSIEK